MINLYDKVTEWRITVSYMQLTEANTIVLFHYTSKNWNYGHKIPFPRDVRKEETSWKSNLFSEEHLILVNLRIG